MFKKMIQYSLSVYKGWSYISENFLISNAIFPVVRTQYLLLMGKEKLLLYNFKKVTLLLNGKNLRLPEHKNY